MTAVTTATTALATLTLDTRGRVAGERNDARSRRRSGGKRTRPPLVAPGTDTAARARPTHTEPAAWEAEPPLHQASLGFQRQVG